MLCELPLSGRSITLKKVTLNYKSTFCVCDDFLKHSIAASHSLLKKLGTFSMFVYLNECAVWIATG